MPFTSTCWGISWEKDGKKPRFGGTDIKPGVRRKAGDFFVIQS